jgi:RNA polymerase sigma-70 factor (ECF subfamily)
MNTGFPDELTLDNYKDDSVPLDQESACLRAAESFEEVFHRHQSMVFNLAYRLLGDREEALDITQEVFLSVYRKLRHFRGASSLKTWIYRITINCTSNRCRWWSRLRRRGTVSLDEHLSADDDRVFSDTLRAAGEDPEQALLASERRREIERSLLRLPVRQRIAVIMRDVEGCSYEEIADLLKVSLGTVKSRIARGREELKRRLNGTLESQAGGNHDM